MFKRLFNWIKFKTLPPSVNFKNRLFLERDSKSRRITSNLGLTFRNSKWADYTRTDINLNLRHSYKHTLTFLILGMLILFCSFYSVRLYNPALLSNDITFFLWAFKDLLAYYIFSLLTLLSILLTTTIEKFYVKFVGWLFLQTPITVGLPQKEITVYPKSQDLKHTLYRWLKNSRAVNLSDSLEPLAFAHPTQSRRLVASFDLKNLFLASQLVTSSTKELKSRIVDATCFTQTPQTPGLGLPLQLHVNLSFLNTQTTWNLSNGFMVNSYSASKYGAFVSSFLTYSKYQYLFTRIQTSLVFDESFRSQLALLKSNRFLYNYSFLHRKVLKNTHKLTTVKRLLGVTWYDSKLTTKNIWASDLFNTLLNSQAFLRSGLDLSYGSLVGDRLTASFLKSPLLLNEADTSFGAFRYYEESFFWLMKRIYKFNSLSSGNNSLGFNPLQSSLKPSFIENSTQDQLIPYSAKLIDNLFVIDLQNSIKGVESMAQTQALKKSTRDLFITFWENELWGGDDEFLLAEFTSSPNYQKNLLPFFMQYGKGFTSNVTSRPGDVRVGQSWALSPLDTPYPPRGIEEGSSVYSENLSRSYTRDLVLWSFLKKRT